MIWGARTALEVVVAAVVMSGVIGVPLGLISGFIGGWIDKTLVFIMDALYAFPSLLLAIVFSFLLKDKFGSGIISAAVSLTAIYIPQYYRVVRSTTVSARESTYIEAARALGARPFTIMRKYLFGNVVQSVPVLGTLNAADALSTLAALGFLGLGIQPTQASEWGYDLSRALDDAQAGNWHPAFWPGLMIVLLITGLTLVGEGLNETLNPALRRRRLQTFTFEAPRHGAHQREGGGRDERDPGTRRGRPGAADGPVLIDARDLRVQWYAHRPRPGTSGGRRDVLAPPGRDPRPRRGVRLRKVDAGSGADRPASRRGGARWRA